jgi:hypothetical protein
LLYKKQKKNPSPVPRTLQKYISFNNYEEGKLKFSAYSPHSCQHCDGPRAGLYSIRWQGDQGLTIRGAIAERACNCGKPRRFSFMTVVFPVGAYRASGGYSPSSGPRDKGSVPGQSTWELWWTKCHWDMFFSQHFALSVSFHRCSILIHSFTTDAV